MNIAIFSPDGNKFAYVKRVPGGLAAVIDGKQSIAYDSIGVIEFSPDSRRAFFIGLKNVIGNFLVIDGQEMPAANTLKNFVFSQDGSRFGYESYSAQSGFTMMIDGKPSQKFQSVIEHSLAFSADGKHSAYGACTNYSKCLLVQDGMPTDITGLTDFFTFSRLGLQRISLTPVLFSPDGTRLAYSHTLAGAGTAVFVNGQDVGHAGGFSFRVFSPDSKHFAAIGT